MAQVNVHEAKTHLSELLARVEAGEEIVIVRSGKPIVRMVPGQEPCRVLGQDRGLVRMLDGFDDPLPPDLLAGFEHPDL